MTDNARPSWTEDLVKLYGLILAVSIIFVVLGYFIEHPPAGEHTQQGAVLEDFKRVAGNFAHYIDFEWAGREYFEKVMAHLVTEIGVAGLVACGIGITIERVTARESTRAARIQREEFRAESEKLAAIERQNIKDDVFYAVFSNLIPKSITDDIITHVLKAPFVRENVAMNYNLSPVLSEASGEKYILVDLEMRYNVINITRERVEFPLGATVQTAAVEDLADRAKFISVIVTGSEQDFSLEGADIPTTQDEYRVKLDLHLPEHKVWIPGDSSVQIAIRTQTVKHLYGGSSYFLFGYHSCDLELFVQIHDVALKIHADTFSERNRLALTESDAATNSYKWKMDRPLLAFQGVYLEWVPAEITETAGPPVSAPVDEALTAATDATETPETAKQDGAARADGDVTG
jgi:hypothetical protein